MAKRTGIVTMEPSGSRLGGEILLARCDEARRVKPANKFLKNLGLKSGDRIQVTGTFRTFSGVTVFCITDAKLIERKTMAFHASRRKKPNSPMKKAKKKSSGRRMLFRGSSGFSKKNGGRKKAAKKNEKKQYRSIRRSFGTSDLGVPPSLPPPPGKRGAARAAGGDYPVKRLREKPVGNKKAKSDSLRGGDNAFEDKFDVKDLDFSSGALISSEESDAGKAPPPQPAFRTIEYTPQLEIKKTLAAKTTYRMVVFVDQGPPSVDAEVEPVKIAVLPEVKEVPVEVWLDCSSHFVIEDVADPSQITIQTETGISNELEFTLRVVKAKNIDQRPKFVSAFFRYNKRPSGKITRYLELKNGKIIWKRFIQPSIPESEVVLPHANGVPSAVIEGGCEPADIRVEVLATEENDGRHFKLHCLTPQGEWKGTWNLPQVTKDFVNARMNAFMQDKGVARLGSLVGAGMEFWMALPKQARTLLLGGIEKGAKTMSVLSEEPYIPWELMVPYVTPATARKPLGVELQLGRWVTADYKAAPQTIPMKKGYIVAPKSSGLTNAPTEVQFLLGFFPAFDANPPVNPADVDGINKALSGEQRNVIHFICHGKNAELQTLEVENSELLSCSAVLGLQGFQKAFQTGPLAFLNACEVGAAVASLDGVGGFANSFIQLGASAVVAPLWSVQDSVALEVTKLFYSQALKGVPFAEVIRQIRAKAYGEAIDSYAAYCFYGDPLASMAKF